MTMQDMKAIFGLQLGGLSVTGIVDNDDWRELVAQFTNFLSLDDEVSKRRSRDPYTPRTWFITSNLCRTNIVVKNL